ncbi:MAG: Uncharacterised protein [Methanobacteriota archaeon]|nr:MAG: Uncharacterised protein [Euryarchaeota archaeon]
MCSEEETERGGVSSVIASITISKSLSNIQRTSARLVSTVSGFNSSSSYTTIAGTEYSCSMDSSNIQSRLNFHSTKKLFCCSVTTISCRLIWLPSGVYIAPFLGSQVITPTTSSSLPSNFTQIKSTEEIPFASLTSIEKVWFCPARR